MIILGIQKFLETLGLFYLSQVFVLLVCLAVLEQSSVRFIQSSSNGLMRVGCASEPSKIVALIQLRSI